MGKKWLSDYDYRDYSYSSGSGSRGWMSKLSTGWRREERGSKGALQDLLNQLQNSANIIGNDQAGTVKVRWSDGTNVNNPDDGNHHIYLSPDNLVGSDGEVPESAIDAMTGKVYLASTLRETVHPSSYGASQTLRRMDTDVSKNAIGLWESVETGIARSKILEDWAGFAPYIAEDARRSSASKTKVQDFIDASVMSPSLDAVTTAISWNLLNPKDQVQVPDCYEECVKVAEEMMQEEIKPENRASSCYSIVSKMNEILKRQQEEQQKQDQKSEGEGGEGEGESSEDGEESHSEGKSKVGKKPSLCDKSLLGERVENKTDKTLSEQQASDPSKGDEEKGEIRAKAPSGMCDMGKKVRVKKEPCELQSEYKSVVLEHRKEIASIRSSLMFRKTQATMVSYGHRSGDIDENSLFKVRMDDDRVMTRTDAINSKRIAICLLVDESGSMRCEDGGVPYYEQARNVAIVLAEGLKGMDGIDVCVYGHTAEDGFKGVTLREYCSPRQRNLASLMGIDARSENHDSWAILHTANIFNRDYGDADRKIMFVISDGEPAGSGYGGRLARQHMLEVNRSCLKKGIEVYGVGIADAFSPETGNEMYGENRCVILHDVKSSLGVMGRFIRQIANKQGVR